MTINKNMVILSLVLLTVCLFLYAVSGILLPFVLAFVLAYFLNPLTKKLTRRKWGRTISSCVVVSGFCVFLSALFLIFIPILQIQVLSFMTRVPVIVSAIWDKIQMIISYSQHTLSADQMHQLSDAVNETAFSILNSLAAWLLNLLTGSIVVFNVISLLFVTPVVLFYVLKDWNQVSDHIKKLVPPKYKNQTTSLWREINMTLAGFIRGQTMVCLFLAVFYGIGLSLVGLDLGALIGLLSGVLSFVPYIGFLTGVILSVLLALSQGVSWGIWAGIGAVFLIGQILESYILTPKLVGESVGLHPVWVIFALLAGGVLFGFVGVLVAVPVAGILGVFLRRLIKWYTASELYKG